MKPHIFCYPLLAVLLACSDEGTAPPQAALAKLFEIHLQLGFFDTAVSVSIDETQVFRDTVTTGAIIAVAAIIPVPMNQGTHRLGVSIGAVQSKDTTFTIADSLFIGVNYNPTTNTIAYRFQRNRFNYR